MDEKNRLFDTSNLQTIDYNNDVDITDLETVNYSNNTNMGSLSYKCKENIKSSSRRKTIVKKYEKIGKSKRDNNFRLNETAEDNVTFIGKVPIHPRIKFYKLNGLHKLMYESERMWLEGSGIIKKRFS